METGGKVEKQKVYPCVQSNLWGMETRYVRRAGSASTYVQSNLWGMETDFWQNRRWQLFAVQSNLWGMETSAKLCQLVRFLRFNRIYEEWKLRIVYIRRRSRACSIESMRNGNPKAVHKPAPEYKVQSNLWGMETTKLYVDIQSISEFNRIYEEWKPVLTLRYATAFSSSIESMRNGNVLSWRWSRMVGEFNRIYEEWKLDICVLLRFGPFTFNRIYEEWKHTFQHQPFVTQQGSIESMRNGNKLRLHGGILPLRSSIESMRNGNSSRPSNNIRFFPVQSNLWGMETTFLVLTRANVPEFNRIYEEWKLSSFAACSASSGTVQSNLWGMETWLWVWG